jgi:hypothetical protein
MTGPEWKVPLCYTRTELAGFVEAGAKRLREPTVGRERAASTQQSATSEEH